MVKRRMSCFEHAGYNYAETHPNFLAFTSRLKGNLSLPQIKNALAKIQKTFPLTRMIIERDTHNNPWLIEAPDREIPIKQLPRKGKDHWHSMFQQVLTDNLPGIESPPLCVYHLQGKDDSDLILVCHHAFVDGVAFFALFKRLFIYLGDPEAPITAFPHYPPSEALIPKDIYNSVKAGFGDTLEDYKQTIKSRAYIQPGSNKATFKNYRYEFMTWCFDQRFTSRLIAKARQERTTVHHAVATAFARAFYNVIGKPDPPIRRFQSPISLRNRLSMDVGENYSCYISFIKATVDCDDSKDYWDVARTLKKAFAEKAAKDDIFQTLVWLNELRKIDLDQADQYMRSPDDLSKQEDRQWYDYDFSLSNVGVVDCPVKVGQLEIVKVHGPSFSAVNRERVISFYTLAGEIQFSFEFDSRYFQVAKAKEIKKLALDYLKQAVDG